MNDARAFARAHKRHQRCAAIAGTTGYFIYSISTDWIAIQHRSRAGASINYRSRAGPSIVQVFCFDDLVVIARGNTPDPIPNSAVKTLSADGTPS